MSAPSIVIVGAGPAGLYSAQALRRLWKDASIDVLDRLDVPFGLIRYGVAPDHAGTKAVSRQFERLFEREGVRFLGGIEIGRDITLDELRDFFDVVVLATGLHGDRRLVIPGEDLPQVYGSGAVTRWFNAHPEAGDICPAFGPKVVVIGAGNVALDIARLLAKPPAELDGSLMEPARREALASHCVRTIDVVARGPAERARFDPALLKEFGRIEGLRVEAKFCGEPSPDDARCVALSALAERQSSGPERLLRFRFNHLPIEIRGDGKVEAAVFEIRATGERVEIPASAVVTAIGFEDRSGGGVLRRAYDAGEGALAPCLAPGLFAVGWFRRGPQGTIPDNRADAKEVVEAIASEVDAGRLVPRSPGRAALDRLLAARALRPTDAVAVA